MTESCSKGGRRTASSAAQIEIYNRLRLQPNQLCWAKETLKAPIFYPAIVIDPSTLDEQLKTKFNAASMVYIVRYFDDKNPAGGLLGMLRSYGQIMHWTKGIDSKFDTKQSSKKYADCVQHAKDHIAENAAIQAIEADYHRSYLSEQEKYTDPAVDAIIRRNEETKRATTKRGKPDDKSMERMATDEQQQQPPIADDTATLNAIEEEATDSDEDTWPPAKLKAAREKAAASTSNGGGAVKRSRLETSSPATNLSLEYTNGDVERIEQKHFKAEPPAVSNQPAIIIDRHRVTNGLAKETVGFVGLNPMGLLVAEKMKTRANISFSIVYDRDAVKSKQFVSRFKHDGAPIRAKSPAELFHHCNFVVCCMSSQELMDEESGVDSFLQQLMRYFDGDTSETNARKGLVLMAPVSSEKKYLLSEEFKEYADRLDVLGVYMHGSIDTAHFICGGSEYLFAKFKETFGTMAEKCNLFNITAVEALGMRMIINRLAMSVFREALITRSLAHEVGIDMESVMSVVSVLFPGDTLQNLIISALQDDKTSLMKANYFGQAIACKMDAEAALHTAARSANNSVQQIANNIGLATAIGNISDDDANTSRALVKTILDY